MHMQAVSYSEARENLKAMIDKVIADRAPLAITRQRGEGAVLISESEWASIEEFFRNTPGSNIFTGRNMTPNC